MVSVLHVIPLSLLLLVCGQRFNRALAANSREALEEVFIISGAYSYTSQGEERIVTYRPVDIPALNQFNPVLFERHINGVVDRPALQFYPGDGIFEFYNFTDIDEYRANIRNNLASLTLDDLPSPPTCIGNVSRVDNEVMKTGKCGSSESSSLFVYTCTSETTTIVKEGPYIPAPGTTKTKLQHFPLPESWLEGQDECVNPCGY